MTCFPFAQMAFPMHVDLPAYPASLCSNFHLTPWKVVGYLGTLMFTGRWFVQLYYTRKHKRVVMPLSFWWMSVTGSALLLCLFRVRQERLGGHSFQLLPGVCVGLQLVRAHAPSQEQHHGRRNPLIVVTEGRCCAPARDLFRIVVEVGR